MGKTKSYWCNEDSNKMLKQMAKETGLSESKLVNKSLKLNYDIFKKQRIKKEVKEGEF